MTPSEYQQLALRTESTICVLNGNERLLHGVLGIGTEAGELQDVAKRALFYKKAIDRTALVEELGDLLWYLALTLDACGITFEEAMERNIAKLEARYPDRFSPEKALNRDLAKERAALEATYASFGSGSDGQNT